jgi:hypothetical protein
LQLSTARAKHGVNPDVSSSSIALRKGTQVVAARVPFPERKTRQTSMILEEVAGIRERPEALSRALEVYRQNMDPVALPKGRIVEAYI